MSRARRRAPWLLYAAMQVLLAFTITFTVLNGSWETFVAIAIAMMIGYGTTGALLASRLPSNPIGWLMLMVGVGFVLTGLTDEYVTYEVATNPGSLPFVTWVGWLSNWIWWAAFAPVPLILLLFPNGRAPSARWRFLVPSIAGLAGLLVLSSVLRPGPIDVEVAGASITNPTGVPGLRSLADIVSAVAAIAVLLGAIASVIALILRFRRSSGDERQQIRWLAYLAALAVGLLLASFVVASVEPLNQIVFYAFFACIGIAFPVAITVSILKYRLYDLDIVVKKAVVAFVLVAVLTAVAVLVVFAVPLAVIGVGGGRGGFLTIAVGIVIGFALSPLRRRVRRFADRLVYGKRATPYEVLSEFAERVGGTYSSEDVLPRMAQLLSQGTGASDTVIWLRARGTLRPVAYWPPDMQAPDEPGPDTESFTVEHQGDPLGLITLRMPANDPMNPTKERLVRDVAGQAGLVLRNVRLIEDLRSSRQRLVAAQDGERRRLERNIHDGAQQQLVALSVQLRLADAMVERDPAKARELLTRLQLQTNETLEDLRDLARGIYPPLLADKGLPAALEAQARKSPVPVSVASTDIGRYPQDVEAAIYFSCLEALQNVAKYAGASRATVRLERSDGHLAFRVADDGNGFDPDAGTSGSGLQGIADRLDAIGGSLVVESTPGSGTTVRGIVPTVGRVDG